MTDSTIQYNPFDPRQVDHHDAILARLRAEAPVHELLPGFFYLPRHQDIIDVCRQPELFEQGRFIPLEEDTRSDDELNLGETNPPQHTRIRKVLAHLLSPPKVRRMEPQIREVCTQIVDKFADRGEADMIADLGVPLPGAVIGPITGIPAEYHSQFRAYSDAYMLRTDPDEARVKAAMAYVDEFDAMARQLIRDRRASSDRPDDVLTGLIEVEDENGKPLSEDKILVHLTKDMIVGGTETTTHMIGNLFYNLCSTPGAYDRVHADRSLVPVAAEETLRLNGPVQILFRVPNADTEIHGCPIPKGSTVALGYAAANRDDALFDDPDTFSLDRSENLRREHLGFGYGVHLCVGAALARLEAVCALDAVLDRIPKMELAPGFEYERVQFFMMKGPVRVNVRF
ncbi:MAG TPA: cytochrome P450 [Acidimicrobiales bacterium]|nr:cytochrome P450 [Acidimicrobiales bacterium]